MYYEEKMIGGVLHCRCTPTSEWKPLCPASLSERVEALQVEIQRYRKAMESAIETFQGEEWGETTTILQGALDLNFKTSG
jgi:hypothetical protein